MSNIAEIWKPIVGFEFLYEVSNLGNVRRIDATCNAPAGRLKKVKPLPSGYVSVKLYKNGIMYSRYVHILVLEAFVGIKPSDQETRHLDNDRSNNILSNLVWGTSSENTQDVLKAGNHRQVKLTDAQVRHIRSLPDRIRSHQANPGELTHQQVAKELGISEVTFYNVRNRRTYKHVQ